MVLQIIKTRLNRRDLFKLLALGFSTFVITGMSKSQLVDQLLSGRKYKRPSGAPKYGDVCFSSRFQRIRTATSSYDSLEAAQAFHATRFDWVYTTNSKFVQRVKELGYNSFGGSVNSIPTDAGQPNQYKIGRIEDLNGNLITAPWMRAGPSVPYWICVNKPEGRQNFLQAVQNTLQAGVDSLQIDDPKMNLDTLQFGGCFCSYCMVGFREYLDQNLAPKELESMGINSIVQFDFKEYLQDRKAPVGDRFNSWKGSSEIYSEIAAIKSQFRAFQQESVARFYDFVKSKINNIPISCNNYQGSWIFPYNLFDYGIAEISEDNANPAYITQSLDETRKRNKAQIYTLVSKDRELYRKVIAMTYACGGHTLVPWDVYLGLAKSKVERYFGEYEDYSDLYKFVRDYAKYFNDYEKVYSSRDVLEAKPVSTNHSSVEIVVRAKHSSVMGLFPSPIVLHLVDWADQNEGFDLSLDVGYFSNSGRLKVDLLQPQTPEKSIKFVLTGNVAMLSIPALNPWTVLILSI
ncbi:MAG: hypothetical protein V7L27_29205 [Nostoc sp.]|uniref:hypothetical protein n=1 Tax=Nostoc sp. TaxID=1180 RepID=UPI002FF767DB